MRLLSILLVSAALFSIGIYGVLVRRNGVLILMSIELMLNAVNINLIGFGTWLRDSAFTSAQVFTLFVIAIAAAEVGIGIAIILAIYRNRASVNIDEVDTMKW